MEGEKTKKPELLEASIAESKSHRFCKGRRTILFFFMLCLHDVSLLFPLVRHTCMCQSELLIRRDKPRDLSLWEKGLSQKYWKSSGIDTHTVDAKSIDVCLCVVYVRTSICMHACMHAMSLFLRCRYTPGLFLILTETTWIFCSPLPQPSERKRRIFLHIILTFS